MKSKLFTKKSFIAVILILAVLIGASYISNITIVASRLEAMAYQKEYAPKISSDGLYLINFEPDEEGNKVGMVGLFMGGDYNLDVSDVPYTYNGIEIYRIMEEAYNDYVGLEKIILPQTIKCIEKKAFYNCSDLKEIYVPSSVTEISDSAFSGTENFTMYVEKDSYAEKFAEKNNIIFDYYTPEPIKEQKKSDYSKMAYEERYKDFNYSIYYYNDTPHCAIVYCSLTVDETDLTVPQQINGVDVTTIATQGFVHCEYVETITLPDTVTSVGTYAFAGCSTLKKVYFTENVNVIGKDIFEESPNAVICAPKDSYAHKYAIENNINFEEINS